MFTPSSAQARVLAEAPADRAKTYESTFGPLQFEHEERRIYPLGDVASHIVGYCG